MNEARASVSRANIIFMFLFSVFAFLFARLVYLQRIAHAELADKAARQSSVTARIEGIRGSILDTRGEKLAESVPAAGVWAYLPNVVDAQDAANTLSEVLAIPRREILDALHKDRKYVPVRRRLSYELGQTVKRLRLPGICVERESVRVYPAGRTACHVTGLAGADGKGLEGLELAFDHVLSGTDGKKLLALDGRRKEIGTRSRILYPARPGDSVVLSIDARIQSATYEELMKAVEKHKSVGAVAIVMDVRTGRLLASVSWPDFDPSETSTLGEAKRRGAMRNRAVTDVYEPGSTFKSFTVSYAVEKGTVIPSTEIDCEMGVWRIRGRTLHDVHEYGMMSVQDVLVHSSNIGAAKTGMMMGADLLHEAVRAFGFGARTGVDMPGEVAGIVRPLSKWSYYSLTSIPMGQEIAVTPLQLIAGYAAIANGGLLLKPSIVERTVDVRGRMVREVQPVVVRRVLSEETAHSIRKMLTLVVSEGTGRRAALKKYTVAGKTGTAQKYERNERGKLVPSHTKYVGSFCGFAPAADPRLVCLVSLDEPHPAHYGGTVAGPAVGAILRRSLTYLGVPAEIKRDD